ncbi:mediator of DNA damage checkpoint protein 1-like isoform X1 [Anopheles darlingi]|uniref:mediator of DNA damage checkpoint protein 1-like isoform X1 n=2 Tax=Anopheles darlingi TaxID=43151 RepID=UPI0021001FF5|nr:mediator of DNA damage checkpoint protein 1-like isoform X1 [Anopheles darlingi]
MHSSSRITDVGKRFPCLGSFTICPKHAAIRLDRESKTLEVMDLCSDSGVIVDQQTLSPLVWTAFGEHNRLVFGSVVVTIEIARSTKSVEQQDLFLDEDSMDFIDCSIAESPIAASRNEVTTTLQKGSQRTFAAINSSAPVHTAAQSASDFKDRRSSLFVAATQQHNVSALSSIANETLSTTKEHSVAKQQEGKAANQVPLEDDGSFDDFFIPETQQPEDDLECPAEPNGSSGSQAIVKDSGQAIPASNHTQEEEYIQITELYEGDNDSNSNDGLFNNKYVEASQNLMDTEIDVSFQRGAANDAAGKRVGSILPDRSVDSISFIEHRNNTTDNMSRIEWNETRVEENQDPLSLKCTSTKAATTVKLSVQAITEPDDRSVTPELDFDKPSDRKDDGRGGSTTPDPHFTGKPQPGVDIVTNDSLKDLRETPTIRSGSTTPDLQFTSKPQSGVNIMTNDSQKDSRETPTIDFDGEEEENQETLEIPRNQKVSLPPQSKSANASIGPYDLETQALDVAEGVLPTDQDAYNLLTQPFSKKETTSFAMPRAPVSVSSSSTNRISTKQQEPIDEDDLLTQPLSPPRFDMATNVKRGSITRVTVHTVMDLDDLVTQPLSPPGRSSGKNLKYSVMGKSKSSPMIDEDDLATQALSPPKFVPLSRRAGGRIKDSQKKNISVAASSMYDVQTQPMTSPTNSCTLDKKVPYVVLRDIKHHGMGKGMEHDPYLIATQPLLDGDVYDLQTQDLLEASKVPENTNETSEENKTEDDPDCTVPLIIESQYLAGKDEPNVSMFNPQINSTVRQSQILLHPNDRDQKKLEISPSSNKENRTGDDRTSTRSEDGDDTDDDDIYMASTMPIGELITSKTDAKAKNMNPKSVGKGKGPEALFQVPSKVENTPKAPKRKPSDLEEFLTPEHPLFALPKPDNILSTTNVISELAMRNRFQSKAKLQYPFGDGSSSDDDLEDKGIFKKTNRSKAFEQELEKAKEDSTRIKQIKKESSAKSSSIKTSRSKRNDDKELTVGSTAEGDRAAKSSSSNKTAKEKTMRRKERSVSKEKETRPTRTRAKTDAKPVYKEENSSDDDQDDDKFRSVAKKKETRPTRTRAKTDAKPVYKEENSSDDDKWKVRVRSGRGEDQKKSKVIIDESVEYVGTNTATEALSKTRGRKRKDVSTDKERDVQSEEGLMKAPTRVSKRQKASNPQYKDYIETTDASRVRSKVDSSIGSGKSSSIVSGDMFGGYNSSNSGSASEGSKRSTRAASCRTMIMFTRINGDLYKDSILRAGCKIVDIPEMATILVTDRVVRTNKFLCAVARGIPIVGQSYLDAIQGVSNGSNIEATVDPWQHILLDRESEKRYKFDLRKTLLRAQKSKLLSGYTVFVTSNTHPPASEIFLMLSSAGAIPLKNPASSRAPKDCDKTFVISCPADASSWEKYREKYPTIEIVSTEWLMCSLMQYSISFKNHRLL